MHNETSPATRRRFLQTATGSTLAALTTASLTPRLFAAGSDEIRLGLIGCGGRGTGAALNALAAGNVKLVVLGDVFRESVDRTLARVQREKPQALDAPRSRQFTGLSAFQDVLQCDLDLVILAAPSGFRPKHFEAAVNSGTHVFMEKPLAVDPTGIRRIQAAGQIAERRNLKVGTGYQRRHQESYQAAIQRIHGGAIGDVQKLDVFYRSSGVWPPRVTRAEVSSELELQIRNWIYFTWLSGDFIVEQHSHNLDISNWILQGHPLRASGRGERTHRIGSKHGDIYDEFVIDFEYSGGVTVHSHCRHRAATELATDELPNEVGELITGSRGQATFQQEVSISSPGQNWNYSGNAPSPYDEELRVLLDAIRNDRPHNEVSWAAESTLTAILGRTAAYLQRPVTWDEMVASDISLECTATSLSDPPPARPDKFGDYPVPAHG
jgi:myo-inositol 2-dehydrogenase/D-chiro-inositol 1-dehydrogenase